jgi:hypothetical protein
MRVIALYLLFSEAFWSSNHEVASAVRCMNQPKSVEGTFKKSNAVLVGEVIEVKDAGALKEARLRVEQSWKGVETKEVIVLATRTAESPRYQVGERYLIFASLQNGKLLTGTCSRTKKVEYAQEDLQQLGAGKKPKE